MADKNVSDPPTIIPKTTKPASEALLNEKVRGYLDGLGKTVAPGGARAALSYKTWNKPGLPRVHANNYALVGSRIVEYCDQVRPGVLLWCDILSAPLQAEVMASLPGNGVRSGQSVGRG